MYLCGPSSAPLVAGRVSVTAEAAAIRTTAPQFGALTAPHRGGDLVVHLSRDCTTHNRIRARSTLRMPRSLRSQLATELEPRRGYQAGAVLGDLSGRRTAGGSPGRPRDVPTATRSDPARSSSGMLPASDTAVAGTPVGTAAPAIPWCTGRRWARTARRWPGRQRYAIRFRA